MNKQPRVSGKVGPDDLAVAVAAAAKKAVAGKRRPGVVAKKKRVTRTRRGAAPEIRYQTYLYRVLRNVHPDLGCSTNALAVMNSFVADMFDRLAGEAARVARMNKRATMTSREVQTAARLVLPGTLAPHAVSEGSKAVTKYLASVATGGDVSKKE